MVAIERQIVVADMYANVEEASAHGPPRRHTSSTVVDTERALCFVRLSGRRAPKY
jgi:hypothetical protein